jgi:hypothetical protein
MDMGGQSVMIFRKMRHLRRAATVVLAGMLAFGMAAYGAWPAVAESAQSQDDALPNIAANQRVVIEGVLPNPVNGSEWVELVNNSELAYQAFLPISATGGASPTPIAGESPALAQPGTDMDGWQLGNDEGIWFDFPSDLPPVPYGSRMIVYFDGAGPDGNDYDFSDGLGVLHTPAGAENVFHDTQGKAVLYTAGDRSADMLRSQLAWALAPPSEE